MDTENRVSPQAPEIEEAIIGACMIEQEALPLVADKLRPEMFYVERHRLIFSALLAMYQAGTKVDILTVKEELLRRGTLEEAGGAYQVTLLSSRVASSAHIEYHAQIVHEKYLRREMIVGLNKLLACSLDDTLDIADTLVDAHNLLDRLEGEFGHNDCMRDMDTLMADTMKDAERRIIRSVNGVTGVPTGLTDLDRMSSGWQDGELVVLAARPSVGKTALALHLARSAAMAGRAVVVYSLEMQGERLADRWLMAASEVNQRHWRPELSQLRESGAIEQDADVVMLLYRPAQARITTDKDSGYPTEGLGVVIVAKQRNGETGNAYFHHNPEMTKIGDYVPPLEYLLKHAK